MSFLVGATEAPIRRVNINSGHLTRSKNNRNRPFPCPVQTITVESKKPQKTFTVALAYHSVQYPTVYSNTDRPVYGPFPYDPKCLPPARSVLPPAARDPAADAVRQTDIN